MDLCNQPCSPEISSTRRLHHSTACCRFTMNVVVSPHFESQRYGKLESNVIPVLSYNKFEECHDDRRRSAPDKNI